MAAKAKRSWLEELERRRAIRTLRAAVEANQVGARSALGNIMALAENTISERVHTKRRDLIELRQLLPVARDIVIRRDYMTAVTGVPTTCANQIARYKTHSPFKQAQSYLYRWQLESAKATRTFNHDHVMTLRDCVVILKRAFTFGFDVMRGNPFEAFVLGHYLEARKHGHSLDSVRARFDPQRVSPGENATEWELGSQLAEWFIGGLPDFRTVAGTWNFAILAMFVADPEFDGTTAGLSRPKRTGSGTGYWIELPEIDSSVVTSAYVSWFGGCEEGIDANDALATCFALSADFFERRLNSGIWTDPSNPKDESSQVEKRSYRPLPEPTEEALRHALASVQKSPKHKFNTEDIISLLRLEGVTVRNFNRSVKFVAAKQGETKEYQLHRPISRSTDSVTNRFRSVLVWDRPDVLKFLRGQLTHRGCEAQLF